MYGTGGNNREGQNAGSLGPTNVFRVVKEITFVSAHVQPLITYTGVGLRTSIPLRNYHFVGRALSSAATVDVFHMDGLQKDRACELEMLFIHGEINFKGPCFNATWDLCTTRQLMRCKYSITLYEPPAVRLVGLRRAAFEFAPRRKQ